VLLNVLLEAISGGILLRGRYRTLADFPHREEFLRDTASPWRSVGESKRAGNRVDPKYFRRTRRNMWAPLKAIPFVRVVRDTVYFVSTQLFVRLKRLATMVTLKRTRRLISPDVSPDFRVDSF